ncbi:hypothetical protein B9G55_06595 [Saccharibacillus sp. O16]|nr:hypothetical protein B9G55_06595 [Saccharibacillus sp. O16]
MDSRHLPIAVQIRDIHMSDYETVLAWSRDERFCSSNDWEHNRDEDEIYRWWSACVYQSPNDFVRKGIEYRHELIGYVDLAFIKDQTAELGIAIGASHYWGRGIGSAASQQMMEYGTIELGIHRYYAETNEHNVSSRKMLEKLGYQETGKAGQEEYRGIQGQLIQYEYNRIMNEPL